MADAQQDDPDLMEPDPYENHDENEQMQRDMNDADRGDTSGRDGEEKEDRSP